MNKEAIREEQWNEYVEACENTNNTPNKKLFDEVFNSLWGALQ